MGNYAFVHYCLSPMWEKIVIPQTERLVASPLYKELDEIFYILTNSGQESLHWVPNKGRILRREGGISSEMITLQSLRRFCLNRPGDRVLYFHGKGVSQLPRKDVRQHTKDCIQAWGEYMEYFMFEEYEACFKALESHDICGVEYRSFPDFHFSGNFWWANSSYLRTLPPIADLAPDRRLAEFWPCYGPRPSVRSLYNFGVDLYHFKAELKSYKEYKERHWRKTKRGLDVI